MTAPASAPIAPAKQKQYGTLGDESVPDDTQHQRGRLGPIALAMLIYFNISGGPFMSENAVADAGPFWAIVAFFVVALIYALPSALICAELGTAMPEDAGVVAWVNAAFGPRWGFVEGMFFSLNTLCTNAVYPLMLTGYIRYTFCPSGSTHSQCDVLDGHLLPFLPSNSLLFMLAFLTVVFCLNWRGMNIIGPATIACVIFILVPVFILCCAGLPSLHPSVWGRTIPYDFGDRTRLEWFQLLSTVVWCMDNWDSAGSFGGEVAEPAKDIPKALSYSFVLTVTSYILPILVCTAALPGQAWGTGFWVQAGYELGGHWLQYWIGIAALVSLTAQLIAGQATFAYEISGIAEIGQLPAVCAVRNRNGVPIAPLVFNFVLCCALCAAGSLTLAVAVTNGLYALGELLEYAAFLRLRWKHPSLHRPFQVPLGLVGCIVLLTPPILICTILVSAPAWHNFDHHFLVAGIIVTIAVCSPLLYSGVSYLKGRCPDAFHEEKYASSADSASEVECSPEDGMKSGA